MLKKWINYIVGQQWWTITNHADQLASKLYVLFNIVTYLQWYLLF